jgi:Fe-S-cluster containining protein
MPERKSPAKNKKRAAPSLEARAPRAASPNVARAPRAASRKRHLPVVAERQAVGCLTCGLCCTYIAVAIDGPRSAKAASEILWHLYHDGVSIYRDGDNEWMVQFESRCRHLLDDNKCAIYERRPHICREYSEESCEVNADGVGLTFYAPDEFLSYLEQKHRRIYNAIVDTHVPDRSLLGRVGPIRNHEPFEARFLRLRTLGDPR